MPSGQNTSTTLRSARPLLVTFATVLLALNAVLLFIWWVFLPGQVQSNGAQFFFIILWSSIALAIYRGISWVRYAIVVLLVTYVGEVLNAQAPLEMLSAMNTGHQTIRIVTVLTLVLLFLPQSHQWFREMRNVYDGEAQARRDQIMQS